MQYLTNLQRITNKKITQTILWKKYIHYILIVMRELMLIEELYDTARIQRSSSETIKSRIQELWKFNIADTPQWKVRGDGYQFTRIVVARICEVYFLLSRNTKLCRRWTAPARPHRRENLVEIAPGKIISDVFRDISLGSNYSYRYSWYYSNLVYCFI